ncbi:pro-MCH isoform X2 [Lagopus muta]|uniref:pro-MCH isoform X2 n=1 Tax=Lagopus muta TaxID=64668 RepID=UPI00209CB777|nr:pro-MCH isoform X2 [Lagopus muta]
MGTDGEHVNLHLKSLEFENCLPYMKALNEDMLLTAINLGRTLRNGDRTEKRGAVPLLKRYKIEESFLDEDDDRRLKFFDTDSRHDFLNHGVPISAGRKQLPYLALKGAIAFPADTEIQNIESIQERETVEEENSAKFPIGRRDFDMLRCMLGRVYRPCWQV